jgi:2-aminobenzoate-CoA ligase
VDNDVLDNLDKHSVAEGALDKGVSTSWGARLFGNVPRRFLPGADHLPLLTFGSPALSYAWSRQPLNACVALLDDTIARLGPDRPALIAVQASGRVTWTYGDLLRRVIRTAAGLAATGVRPGDRVLVRMPDVPETVVVQLAVWRLGGIVVPSSVLEAAGEVTFMLNDTEAVAVVCSSAHAGELEKALPETPTVRHVIGWPESVAGGPTLDAIAEGRPDVFEPHPTMPLDASGIYYTGGTTGLPKGCLHTHAAEVALADLNNAARGAGEDSVFLTHAPIGHAFGNGEKVNFPLRAGGAVVLLDRPGPADMWAALAEFGVTTMAGAATMYRMMLADPPPPEVVKQLALTSALSSGEVLDPTAQDKWTSLMPVRLRNAVGMTPMRHLFIDSNVAGGASAPGLSVGAPLPGYEARLLAPDGSLAAPGEPGRLAVRGPSGITYWINKHPAAVERSQQDVVDGWSLLDDAYFRDVDGWLWFHGRLDDMIVTGGRQVAPIEVERALSSHPAVAEVCVVPAPDPVRGQVVTAVVVVNGAATSGPDLAAELQAYVKDSIASYKYPRRIEFVDQLPKDGVGKIQRRRLRERFQAETGAPS